MVFLEKDELIEKFEKIFNLKSDVEKLLGEKERQSLYKMIAAMTYEMYGYNETAKQSHTTKEISDAISGYLDEDLDVDTVLKWLKAACQRYPNYFSNKSK